MKRVAALVFSLAMVVFSVPALNAQTETGSTGTQNTQTDSTNSGTTGTTGTDQSGSSTGTTGTDQSGSSTGNTQGTGQDNTGTTGTGTTGMTGTDNSGSNNTGTSGMGSNNSGTTGTTTESGSTGMNSAGSGMSSFGMNNSGTTPAVQDLSRLDEKPAPEVVNEFKPVAEERANELVSKLGLEQDKADKIRESIMDYFNNYWESRVSLDKDSNDPDEVSDHNADLADQRVDLIADIEDELTDDQINQFRSFKVDWWKSLDIALFDVQQNAATSSLARDNKEGSDKQQ